MMDRHSILNELDHLGLDRNKFWVIMGAALVLHGIKEYTNDIDLGCSIAEFENLLLLDYEVEYSRSGKRKIILTNQITIYEGWGANHTILVDGYSIASISDVIKDKLKLNREKDRRDIDLIILSLLDKNVLEMECFDINSQGNQLKGYLHTGHQYSNLPKVIVHGYFSSNKIGPYKLYIDIARVLSAIGFPILRIDLAAMGESDGLLQEIKFQDHICNLHDSINALLKKSDRVGIIAHCAGCYLAMNRYFYEQENIESMAIIAPVINDEDYSTIINDEEYTSLMKNGYTIRKGMHCDESFFLSSKIMENLNICEKLSNKNVKLLVAERDSLVDSLKLRDWAEKFKINYEIIDEADHNFLNRKSRLDLIKQIVILSLDSIDG